MKKTFLTRITTSKEALLYVMTISMVVSFSAWMSLLNNFTVEVASFDGSQIGILQSLREIPGLLAFTVILVLAIIAQQRLVYLSIMMLGLGTALTGFFPTPIGLYITTVIMSIGFHYLETLNQSLSLQWLDKSRSPIVLGKLFAVKSFAGLLVFILIYILMNYLAVEYKYVYLIFGGFSFILGLAAWFLFTHFKEAVIQERKLRVKKEYWLFYLLTFLAGARRQIFVVFAGFLLVEKFGVDIHNMIILLFVNSILNMYIAPKIGKFIVRFGERLTLRLEYLGLMIVFVSYAFVDSVSVAFALYLIDHLLFAMAITLKTYFQKIADPKDISSASAVSFTINHIAAVFLPAVLGLVWLYSNSLVFIIGAVIAFVSFALSNLVPKEPEMGYETTLVRKDDLQSSNA
ncbi:MFS transporter [Malaciobacter pacificus]|uniref:Major facilitator superfamily transporter n=1 Tax=Malaciobacter pacificus TaxID=1080223 RepID=A0A5C2HCJ2_9BACT|nr:MFS transporter [Malaciobacter pacificus]QEP34022.1 major facilitator superfamily transporter [Malaciobacter pacificus]GGD35905.1 MFS transporter [Malaciobacter pacificus]